MDKKLLPEVTVAVPPEGLSIGATAEATGVSVEALRYYEREGLMLDPTPRDAGGRRRYGLRDLEWIGGLVMLRETGMPIADVRVIADLSRTPGTEAQRVVEFERHRERVIEDLERTKRHLVAIDTKIAAYRAAAASPGTAAHPGAAHPATAAPTTRLPLPKEDTK
ncbi:MerR family transcriptional regulator [Glaciihabitans sp. dw_435]|uniref:MerR family transcriptional regulator n=1 Tax=Glaciihabitans sp. dw_435 TaxID=2720081 RepID=UPI001BD2928F|nr:MerR family transcriptional regulator [Glaciihabitans sp. dw_435]